MSIEVVRINVFRLGFGGGGRARMTCGMPARASRGMPPAGMSRGQVFMFALAGGSAVGNLYWSQPLLSRIAETCAVSEGTAGLLVTATQIGYAIGVFLIVPLGDVANRRRLIPALMFCAASALMMSAVAPNFASLAVGLLAVGVTTVSGQLLTPFAGDLVRPEYRGRVVGAVVSGILTGILLSRTVSGLLGDLFGWRSVYVIAATVSLVIASILARTLPADLPRARIPYRTLLVSVIRVIGEHRVVGVTLIIGAMAFSVFMMFWTGLTFLLSAPPFSYSLTQIGAVGLVGLAGALGAQPAGILHDKGWSVPATGLGLLVLLVSLAIAATHATSLVGILIAVLLLDVAVQGLNVLNQTRLFSVDPSARSRLNTVFVTGLFTGGAFGSALAGVLWEIGGWTTIMCGAGIWVASAFVIWMMNKKSLDLQ